MKLQTGSDRLASRVTRGDAQIRGSLEVGHNKSAITTDAYFKLPTLTTTQRMALTAEEGMQVYDTTLGEEYTRRSGGWGTSSGSAAGSLDAAYNGGAEIAVDGGAFTLTDTQTDTNGALLVTKSGVITGATDASVVHINSTGAHDSSGTVKFLEISVGSETITTPIGAEIEMNANGDNAVLITKGALEMTDGAVTLTSGNFTMSSGNASVTGTMTVTSTSALEAVTTSSSITSEGQVIVDVDNAEAFLIRENGDAADVFTVDTTQDAGDTTAKIASKTTSGYALHVDSDTTTGAAVLIDADAVTSGDGLLISIASGTMTAAGAAISVIDSSNSDREVFAIRDDGTAYFYGTAEGTVAVDVIKGDLEIDDGDLYVKDGEVSFVSSSTTSGLVVTNNAISTGDLVSVSSTSITDGALMKLNSNAATADGEVLEVVSAGDATSTGEGITVNMNVVTTGAATGIHVQMDEATTHAKGIAVQMDKITSGDMLYLDAGGSTLNGGFYINCNDDNVSDFTVGNYGATVITGQAAGTSALTMSLGDLTITDTDTTTITSVNGTGSIVEVISGGAIGADKACLEIDAAGAPHANGSLLRLSAEGVTATNSPFAMQIDCASLDMGAINIVSAPTTNSAIVATTTGVLAADKAIVELVSNAAACNADSSVVRIEQTAVDGVAHCATVKQDDIDKCFVNFEGATAANFTSPISTEQGDGTVEGPKKFSTSAGWLWIGMVRCAINGTKGYIPYYEEDPS